MKEHHYPLHITWTGNRGTGTSAYTAYGREHRIEGPNKAPLDASADTPFQGDATKYNPEDMLVASLSACHMLWFLHLCADRGIIVTAYEDHPMGVLQQESHGSGQFKEVTLNPVVTITNPAQIPILEELHQLARQKCFIANSVNFPVHCLGTGKAEE
jgi:organic hydroperoxide reductase OsmC/OhrA